MENENLTPVKRILTRETILGAKDMTVMDVPTPEWDGEGSFVVVKRLNARERDNWEAGGVIYDSDGKSTPNFVNMRARLCALTIVDEEGKRIFTDEDVVLLGEKSSLVITRIYDAACKLSGIGQDKEKNAVKNSEATQEKGSTIG